MTAWKVGKEELFDIQTHKNFRTSKTIIQNRCFFSYFFFEFEWKIRAFIRWDSTLVSWSMLNTENLKRIYELEKRVEEFCEVY